MKISTRPQCIPGNPSQHWLQEIAAKYRRQFPGATRGGWDLDGEIPEEDVGTEDDDTDWLEDAIIDWLEEFFGLVPDDFSWTDELTAEFDQWLYDTFGY